MKDAVDVKRTGDLGAVTAVRAFRWRGRRRLLTTSLCCQHRSVWLETSDEKESSWSRFVCFVLLLFEIGSKKEDWTSWGFFFLQSGWYPFFIKRKVNRGTKPEYENR